MDVNAPDHSWSLTLALRSIAHRAGYEIALDDLHAALGLSLLVCAVPTERSLAYWSMYARDVFLTPAARAFGITLRAVHPPEAARGLDRADEFRQHFDASYRPLIERALENSQPVLTWQGWPGDHGNAWGIITRRCDDGVGFGGTIISSPSPRAFAHAKACAPDSAEFTLTKPPLQLYVAERVTPTAPSSQELLTLALDHALSVLNNEPGSAFGVVMGPAAFDEWIARLKPCESDEVDSGGSEPGGLIAGHRLLSASVADGHRAMLRFLRRHGDDGGADRAELINRVVTTCGVVVSELGEPTDLPATRKRLQDPADPAELTDHLLRAKQACEGLRSALTVNIP